MKLTVVIQEQGEEDATERKHKRMSKAVESPRVAMVMVFSWGPGSVFNVTPCPRG